MANDPENPRLAYFNRQHRTERGLDQLLGYCQGVLADGHVSVEEALTLRSWIENNWDLRTEWPAGVLYERLDQALADGVLDADEQRDLIETILDFTGGPLPTNAKAHSTVTTLPLTRPLPTLEFFERSFCVTGVFEYGKRAEVTRAISEMGGAIHANLRRDTHYLVIGSLGSADWVHASFGRKILAAVKAREDGCPIMIVSEAHWANFV